MFTGIIQEIGSIAQATRTAGGVRLTVDAPQAAAALAVSDSVSINGACQTVIERAATTFTVQAVEETLRKTTLGGLVPPGRVNIELALRMGDRLGGHLVLGHVDCTGEIRAFRKLGSSWLLDISHPPEFSRYLIPVGSVAVDGVSLTVAEKGESFFRVSIIPHTLGKTTLSEAVAGGRVNLEFDMLGKYVESLLTSAGGEDKGGITAAKLREWGYGA